jgi:putative cell wall-binding protein
LLSQEDDYVKKVCDEIIKFKPDLVITEKGKKKKF